MIPFLSVKPSAIRLKVKSNFPASLIGGVGLVITKANGVYTIDLNYAELQAAALGIAANEYMAIWDSASNQFFRIKISDFTALVGGVPEAPNDGNYYSRRNLGWAVAPPFAEPANDGKLYGRAQTAGVGAWARAVPNAGNVSGDAMTGPLWLSGDPVGGENLRATTKQYVDGKFPVEATITPVFAATGGGAIGNGVVSGKVIRLAPTLVLVGIDCTFGSTTTFGTGYFNFTLPAPYNNAFSIASVGAAWYQDVSAGQNYIGSFLVLGGNVQFIMFSPAGTLTTNLVPFTWATGDRIALSAICWGV